ncbi:hypothetical protein KM043_006781 [Ampulex compressa]|nr:hypothetical protein KM043_006781 [Ampulex compressa]
MYKFVIIGALFAATALAAPAERPNEPSMVDEAFKLYSSCSAESDLMVCLKLRALRFVEKYKRAVEIPVFDGFKIVQTEEAKNSRADNARSLKDFDESTLPAEPEAKEAVVDQALVDTTTKFLSTHTVELSVPEEISRSFDEARGKKKKIVKSLVPILLFLKLKAAAILPIILGSLALIAFKALFIGKIALIVSAILGLQKLLSQKHQSYEVVAHPVHGYSHEEHHDHHGWARSSGSDLAYNAYKPSK